MHNSLLLERMLQSAVGSVLNIEEPLKLDINCKLSTYAANPRLLVRFFRFVLHHESKSVSWLVVTC